MTVITKWYNLQSKYIIHTVAPVCYKYNDDSWMVVMKNSYNSCLKLAEDNWIKSISFPFLWAWVFCCDREKSAKIALDVAKNYISNNPYSIIESINFILWREEDYDIFNYFIN